jgi:ATP-dependent RNA helicase DeaD
VAELSLRLTKLALLGNQKKSSGSQFIKRALSTTWDLTLQQFSELNISPELKKGIKELGYVTPTDFQRGVFESFNDGKNVLGDGQSSYGKSLAFSLPILSKIAVNEPGPQALIICETALQSDLCIKECKALGRHLNIIVSNSLTNGNSEQKPHILVWTFDDLAKADMSDIMGAIRIVFFDGLSSNNMAKAMEMLADLFNRGVQILVFGQDAISACKNSKPAFSDAVMISNHDQPKITAPAVHIFHQAKDTEPKPRALLAALEYHRPQFALVTVNESQECELLARYIARYGYKTTVVTEENNRSGLRDALKEGLDGGLNVLICQNSLVVGQSLERVAFMINYDMFDRPQDYEETTQFNKQAPGINRTIVNILTSGEVGCLGPIKAQCQVEFKEMPLPGEDEVINLCVNRIVEGLNKEASSIELGQFVGLSEKFVAHPQAQTAISLLLRNHFLKPAQKPASQRDNYEPRDRRPARSFNERDPRPDRGEQGRDRAPNPPQSRPSSAPEGISRLYVTLGRKDGFMDLASLAQYLSDFSKVDLGHFSGGGMIRDNSAHIEVDDDVAEDVIKALHDSPRPNASAEGDGPVVCERAKAATHPRPNYRYQQRRRPNFPRR